MTLKEILKPEATDTNEVEGWAISERLYASLGSPKEGLVLAQILQKLIDTLKRKHVRYPAIFIRRRAQLLGKASDGSNWSPGEKDGTVDLPKQTEPLQFRLSEEALIAHAKAAYSDSPGMFERWLAIHTSQLAEPRKTQVIEMRKKAL